MGLPAQSSGNYGLSSLVMPGDQQKYRGKELKDFQNLKNMGRAMPHLLDGLTHLIMTEDDGNDCIFGEIMSLIQRREQGRKATKRTYGQREGMKQINSYEVQFRIAADATMFYTVIQPPVGVNGYVGADGSQFSFVINNLAVSVDDVFMLNERLANHQIKVTKVEQLGIGQRITVYILKASPAGLPVQYFSTGSQFGDNHRWNQKTENSQHGSQSDVTFGRTAKTALTTMRLQEGTTGHAKYTKDAKDRVVWLNYIDPKKNEELDLWLYESELIMRRHMRKAMDAYLFWGKADVDRAGNWREDTRGWKFISGDGVLEQCNKRQYIPINRVNRQSINLIMERFYYSGMVGKKEIVVIPGIRLRVELSEWIMSQFQYAPQVLYVDKASGEFYGSTPGEEMKKDKNARGISTRFNYYETDYGTLYVAQCSWLDNNKLPQHILPDGSREDAHTGFFVDVTPMRDSKGVMVPQIEFFSVEGRDMIFKTFPGMASDSAIMATVDDRESQHLLTTFGVAVRNPNCLHACYKPRTFA